MSEEKIDEQENFSEEEYSGEEEEFHTFEEEKTGDSNLSAAEKKRKYKELKESRKKHKPNYEEISKAKKLWEIARNTKVDEKERDEAMSELVSTIKGKLGDISLKRDASRIIQTCLKQGTPEQRLLIASELKGSYVSLSMNMYSKFIVTKVLNYCPSMRNDIINEFRGQIVKLIKHKDASSVIDEIFQVYANASQKLTLIEEFFGSQFIILKKIDKSLTVEKLFENEPNKRDVIMKHMGTTLQSIVNKGSLQFALVHRVLHDFLLYATPSEAKDLIEMLKEIVLAELVHTKEGMFVALCVLAQSEAKQRKSIVKGLKQHLEKILLDEFGAIFVVGVLYLMDDTVLVSKAILLDYFHKLDDFIVNENARKIILYLLC
ncbi:ARM repeat-containing protein, partial [Rozella allomycis CSF55]